MPAEPRTSVSDAHLRFAATMHAALASGTSSGSVCWSPYSVAAALTMAELGSAGRTADELRTLLGGAVADREALLRGAAELDASAVNVQTPTLAVCNAMYTRRDLPVLDSFAAAIADLDGAVLPAPFEQPERARQQINEAVARTTRELITEAVPPGAIDASTVAALVNALYLKAAWVAPFQREETVDAPFQAPDGTRTVPTMRTTGTLGYAATAGWQVVSLSAAGGVTVEVLLPDDPDTSLSTVDPATLTELVNAPERTRVRLTMPRLDLDFSATLNDVLVGVGATAMFSDDAEFSGISPRSLSMSKVLHKSVLRVDEAGLLGAAATVATMRVTALREEQPPVVVTVDRSFLLLVRHADTGAIYFLATVREP